MVAPRVFRGQREPAWQLASPFERLLDKKRRSDKQRSIRRTFEGGAFESYRDGHLARFKEYSRRLPYIEMSDRSDDDWWALGRHHGLITPLLDWTRSPYVASYFAYMDRAEADNRGFTSGTHEGGFSFSGGHVVVWELSLVDELEVAGEFHVVTTHVVGYRQIAQQALFTKLDHEIHLDLESYLASRGLSDCLCKYELPDQEIGKALKDLQLMGITPFSIFPDLDGAASMANLDNRLTSLYRPAR